jgi:hypothetical protein
LIQSEEVVPRTPAGPHEVSFSRNDIETTHVEGVEE